jgi:hypothetical protein
MMDDAGMRSARHFWQRRCEVGRAVRKEVDCGGDEDGDVEAVEVLMAELRRRRKGRLGKR